MQHQIIVSNVQGVPINELISYVEYVNNLNREFIDFQSTRIGMPKEQFIENTKKDWWITAEQGVQFKMLDKLVNIICDSQYALTNYTKNIKSVPLSLKTMKNRDRGSDRLGCANVAHAFASLSPENTYI